VTYRRAYAPGRLNLIGDHTDYSGGLVLPMAIDLGTTIEFRPAGDTVTLSSEGFEGIAVVSLAKPEAAIAADESWTRYVAGVIAVLRPEIGGTGRVSSTLPIGAGLSSSAALEVAVALAVGFAGTALALAQACQAAEHLASGVPCGIMDQLASAAGIAGHALLIDCTSLAVTPAPIPAAAEFVAVHSGEARSLAATGYAERRSAVEAAQVALGRSLRLATVADVESLRDMGLRRRARHVVTENRRVIDFAAALGGADLTTAGALMVASHASLRDDFGVSTAALDALVDDLSTTPGVFGARLTGAGFGGCAVALVESGRAASVAARYQRAWVLRAAGGARVAEVD